MSVENDVTTVVGDAEFEQLARSGAYTDNDDNILRRSEGDQHFFVWRQSEWDRLQRLRAKVEAEIDAQEAAEERRGM
jgi:hypothetical protein